MRLLKGQISSWEEARAAPSSELCAEISSSLKCPIIEGVLDPEKLFDTIRQHKLAEKAIALGPRLPSGPTGTGHDGPH
eukprot:7606299-Pyramimonas_sp.AAC.1